MEKIITANMLADGNVVYLMADGKWSDSATDAAIATDSAAVSTLIALAEESVARNDVIDPQPIPIEQGGEAIVPSRLREKIRAAGPTVRNDLGYQAER